MLRKQETLQRIKEEKRKTDEKQHSHRHRYHRESGGDGEDKSVGFSSDRHQRRPAFVGLYPHSGKRI